MLNLTIIDELDSMPAPFPVEFDDHAEYRAALDAYEAAADEMDAPTDWDSGSVTFDPYL